MAPKPARPPPDSESIRTFMALKRLSSVTKRNYMMRIKLYLDYIHKAPDVFVKDTQRKPREFEKQFIAFLEEWGKGARPSTVAFVRDSLRRFLQVNRVENVNWNYISDFIPQRRKYGEDRAPTIEEIHRIVSTADLRLKCLVLFLCSSGSRIGAIEYLKWRDIKQLEYEGQVLAGVTVYNGEPERYTTFISPEAYSHLLEYKKMRENIGEKVAPESHVFVTLANVDNFRPEAIKPISVSSMKNLLGRHLRKLGMRSVIHEGRDYHSFDFKQAHGFRKFFKTRMEMKGVKPIIIEMLMGHTLGVSSSYMKPTDKELLEEYFKAVDELTIINRQTPSEDQSLVTLRTLVESAQVDLNKESVLRYLGEKLGIEIPMIMEKQRRASLPKDVLGFGQPVELPPVPARMDVEKLREQIYDKLGVEEKFRKVDSDPQMLVEEKDLESYLEKGWEFVSTLPSKKILIRRD